MATVTLGNIKFNWKGAWNSGTAYVIDDVVSLSGSSYVSIQAGTNQNPASASAYWQQMSAAGTDGTDVGATLNNKEIAFKTNAGAVDGIPIGNAGEFLKVNSGATGYEYGAVSSNMVKIAGGSTTASASIDIQGCFSATYKIYKLIMGFTFAAGTYIEVGLLNASDNSHNGNTYRTFGNGQYSNNTTGNSRYTSTAGSQSGFGMDDSQGFRPINTWQNYYDSEHSQLEMTFDNPFAARKTMMHSIATWSQPNYVGVEHAIGAHDATVSISGLRIGSASGSNFTTTGYYAVYGLKN